MNTVKIRGLEKNFVLEPGKIYNINIENRFYYQSFMRALMEEDSEFFLYFENGKEVPFMKRSLVINDLFNIDPNNKKTLTSLYKRINETVLQNTDAEDIQRINGSMLELLQKISFEMNMEMEYETDLDITKILSLYKFSFKRQSNNLLESVVTYIKANMEIMNLKILFMIHILPLLKEQDMELFQKELEFLNLTVIHIQPIFDINRTFVENITIDNDFCEF